MQWAFCCFLTQHAGRLDSVCLCSGSGWWDCPGSLIREKPDVPYVLPGRTEGRGRRHEMPKSRFPETHLVLAFPSPTPGRKVSPNCGRGCSHWVECSIGPSPSAYKIGQARPRLVQTTDTSFEFPERVFSFDNFEWGASPLPGSWARPRNTWKPPLHPARHYSNGSPCPFHFPHPRTGGCVRGPASHHAWPDFGQPQPPACHIGVGIADDVGEEVACCV